jgi:hypothetical protein
MQTVHYYFDESGEKGFVGPNFSMSDIGLIAGIALPQNIMPAFESEISRILFKLKTSNVEKLHATELFKDGANATVKAELLEFLKNYQEWLLVYEAVYPLGLYKHGTINKSLLAQQKPINPQVKISSHEQPQRIYTELLEGIILKLDEICRIEDSSTVVMYSDRIDNGLFKEAEKTLNYLRQGEHKKKVSGFNTQEKKVVYGTITSWIRSFNTTVNNVSEIKNEIATSNMIIVADVITNTL